MLSFHEIRACNVNGACKWPGAKNVILQLISSIKVRKEAKIWKRYNQVPHLTQDTTWESNKNKHHQQEPRGQPFPSRWAQGSNEQMQKHEKHKTQKTQMIHQRSPALKLSVKYFTGGLKPVSRPLFLYMYSCTRKKVICLVMYTPKIIIFSCKRKMDGIETRPIFQSPLNISLKMLILAEYESLSGLWLYYMRMFAWFKLEIIYILYANCKFKSWISTVYLIYHILLGFTWISTVQEFGNFGLTTMHTE